MTASDLSIKPVALRLLGDPNRVLSTKGELRYGRKGSLAVNLTKSTFYDHESGEGGGVLDLVSRERGGTHRDAIEWLKAEGLAENSTDDRPAEKTAADRRAQAFTIWEASRPALHTPAQDYLACRGIVLQPAPCIRYHDSLNALVAAVQRPDGRFAGIQRIYLKRQNRGACYTSKRSLGSIRGGAVRLMPAASSLQITESLEDGLALLQITGRPTWACLGTSMLAAFDPPPGTREVILAPDHDDAGLKAIETAVKTSPGGRLRQLLPPEGRDWCDVLEEFEEGAGIYEFDAELVREETETRSWVKVFCDGD